MSWNGASRLSPQIIKELRRHVKSGKSPTGNSSVHSSIQLGGISEKKGGRTHTVTILGCMVVIGVTASLPYVCTRLIGSLNERDAPLTYAQVRRGAFNNSGSKDIGKDPQWDFHTGTYIKDKEYHKLFEKNESQKIDHDDRYVPSARRG